MYAKGGERITGMKKDRIHWGRLLAGIVLSAIGIFFVIGAFTDDGLYSWVGVPAVVLGVFLIYTYNWCFKQEDSGWKSIPRDNGNEWHKWD